MDMKEISSSWNCTALYRTVSCEKRQEFVANPWRWISQILYSELVLAMVANTCKKRRAVL